MDGNKRKAASENGVCSKRGKLCGDSECSTCFVRSLASSDRVEEFKAANPDKNPLLIAISSNKSHDWKCACGHTFEARCCDIARGFWCPYCCIPKQRLCGTPACFNCFQSSVASSARVNEFVAANPDKNPLLIAISSGKKYAWQCSCGHTFEAACNNMARGFWCPYCCASKQKLCGDPTCFDCFGSSLASSVRLNDFVGANPDKDPLTISISSGKKFTWLCSCGHKFDATCFNVQSGHWCPYCAGRICGKKECLKCAPPCDTCSKKSHYTLKNSSRACYECYVASGEARAKVRLEIFFLAELQRVSADDFEFLEPTSWDCAVLPGLPYKPDMLWAFDVAGNLFNTTGSCKLSLTHIKHIVVLEVLEVGIEQHSKARAMPDAVRESEIRDSLVGVVVDFVYVVIAAYNHPDADASDKFFRLSKISNGYGVVASRKEAWRERVRQTLEALGNARKRQTGATVFIGS